MRYLLAEDEEPQRLALEQALAELWPEAERVASCADGLEALEAFERERPHVLFLDLRMPGLDGLEVARAVAGRAHLVFVTAHDSAAVAAFEQGAIDYVLKPVRKERLAITLARLRERAPSGPLAARELTALLEGLRSTLAPPAIEPLRWVTASVRDTVKLYSLAEICGFQAQDKYTRVLTASDDALIRTSLRELWPRLDPEQFWQVHRSVIVRVSAIDKVSRDLAGKAWLTLRERPEHLPVSSAVWSRLRGM